MKRSDSGWSWVVLTASSLSTLIAYGIIKSNGLLYTELPLLYNTDRSTAALVTSTKSSLIAIMGPLSGMLCSRFSCRQLVFSAAIISSVGLMTCFFAPTVLVFFVGYGVICGIGGGLSAIPSRLIVTQYFVKKRTLALGLSMTGSCVGGMVMPPLFELLIEHYGLQGSMMIMSAIMLHLCAFAMVYFPIPKERPKPLETLSGSTNDSLTIVNETANGNCNNNNVNNKEAENVSNGSTIFHNGISHGDSSAYPNKLDRFYQAIYKELSVLRNFRFLLIAFTAWGGVSGIMGFILCLPEYAMTESHDNVTRSRAAILLSGFAAGDLVGRLIITWMSNRRCIPLTYNFTITLLLQSAILSTLPLVHSYIGLLVFSVLSGIVIGATLVVPTFLINHYLPSRQWASAYGFSSLLMAIPSAVIGPLLGKLRESTKSYVSGFYLLSGIALCCSLAWIVEIFATHKKKHGSYNINSGEPRQRKLLGIEHSLL